jgi:hypothetical protein
MATVADRILKERLDDRRVEVVLSGSRAQSSSSSKRSLDPKPDGSSYARLPAAWGPALTAHKTHPRRRQERDRQSRRQASLGPSGSTAAQAASRVDVSLARTRSTYFRQNSARSQGPAPLTRTGRHLQPGHPGALRVSFVCKSQSGTTCESEEDWAGTEPAIRPTVSRQKAESLSRILPPSINGVTMPSAFGHTVNNVSSLHHSFPPGLNQIKRASGRRGACQPSPLSLMQLI